MRIPGGWRIYCTNFDREDGSVVDGLGVGAGVSVSAVEDILRAGFGVGLIENL